MYKYIDEYTIKKYNGGFVVLNNRIYTNPKKDILLKAGYKPLKEVAEPEYNLDNQYLEVTYINTDVCITPVYKVITPQ